MFIAKHFFRTPKLLLRSFCETSPIKTYKIQGTGAPPGGVNWTSESDPTESRVEHELEALLGALAGCENSTAKFFANQLGITLKGLSYKVEADYDFKTHLEGENIPNRFTQLRMDVEVDTDASLEEILKLKDIVIKRCPVHSMLKLAGVEIKAVWKKKEVPAPKE